MTGKAPGKARRTYSEAKRQRALKIYESQGPTAVHRLMGIPTSTVERWAKKHGVRSIRNEKMAAAIEARKLDFDKRRQNLALNLMGDSERLREQLFSEATVHHWDKDGNLLKATLNMPTFVDQKQIAIAFGTIVDKMQLLSGGPTSRDEVTADHRSALLAKVEKLAAGMKK